MALSASENSDLLTWQSRAGGESASRAPRPAAARFVVFLISERGFEPAISAAAGSGRAFDGNSPWKNISRRVSPRMRAGFLPTDQCLY
ncbi:hypothetical protein EVAR_26506_1 [Eumeta japonica]|uniref:Uncharacterized protein n=1 Tax=Eumeta variegata TaxID=151549 RepID=A0A4C1V8Q9_EUMVA|nr:hypothetical protein EVAR_26506_1 [Eumeta japonica]